MASMRRRHWRSRHMLPRHSAARCSGCAGRCCLETFAALLRYLFAIRRYSRPIAQHLAKEFVLFRLTPSQPFRTPLQPQFPPAPIILPASNFQRRVIDRQRVRQDQQQPSPKGLAANAQSNEKYDSPFIQGQRFSTSRHATSIAATGAPSGIGSTILSIKMSAEQSRRSIAASRRIDPRLDPSRPGNSR